MGKLGSVWQGNIFLQMEQYCLYCIPPRLCCTCTSFWTFPSLCTSGRICYALWKKTSVSGDQWVMPPSIWQERERDAHSDFQWVKMTALLCNSLRGSWACCSYEHSSPGLAIQKQMSSFNTSWILYISATRHIYSSCCLASDLSVCNSNYKGITAKIPQISQQHQGGTCCNF